MVDCPYCGWEPLEAQFIPLPFPLPAPLYPAPPPESWGIVIPPVCPCCSWAYSPCERAQLERDFLEALLLMPES